MADPYNAIAACAAYCEAGSITQVTVDASLIVNATREMERLMAKLNDVEMIAEELRMAPTIPPNLPPQATNNIELGRGAK